MKKELTEFSELKRARFRLVVEICKGEFKALGEIAAAAKMNKHTLRVHYIYPMVAAGLLETRYPKGAKAQQRYKSCNDR